MFLVLVLSGSPISRSAFAEQISFDMVKPTMWTGEPYALAGNRMVFTNWYYVRAGGYSWRNAEGKAVNTSKTEALGPWDAHFQRAVDAPSGVHIVAEEAKRVGPIITAERPWEKMGVTLGFVMKEGGKYRGWGPCQDGKGVTRRCYFESKDGLHWVRPNMGLVEYDGDKNNNLIPDFPSGKRGLACSDVTTCIFIDPTAPPEEKYKCVKNGRVTMDEFRAFASNYPGRWEHRALRKDAGFIYALHGYTSADGVTWNQMPEPLTIEHTDTQVVGYYDTQLKKYVIYTRNYHVGPTAHNAPDDPKRMGWLSEAHGSGRRSIGRTESDGFDSFPVSEVIVVPRIDMSPSALLYTMCYTTIPGAPDHHLMFPSVWDTRDDTTHLEMLSSHDGKLWQWVSGDALMETANFGEFDGGCIFWHPNLIELANGDWALPYSGYAYPHKYPRGAWSFGPGYAVWPKGRLVGIEAAETGQFSTVSIMAPGRKLRINAVTKRAGKILVAVAKRNGIHWPRRSFEDAIPIIGDHHYTLVRWKDGPDMGFDPDDPICLQFRLDRAKIYGIQFE
jgi:hypothetical protein